MNTVEDLEERIHWLESLLKGTEEERYKYQTIFGLPALEAIVFSTLMSRTAATQETLMFALYGDRIDDWPNNNNLSQYILRLRKKLKKYNVKIVSARGKTKGLYHISQADKDIIRSMYK